MLSSEEWRVIAGYWRGNKDLSKEDRVADTINELGKRIEKIEVKIIKYQFATVIREK